VPRSPRDSSGPYPAAQAEVEDDASSIDGLDNNLPDDNFIRNSPLSFQWDSREDEGDEWPVSALVMVMILLHVIYPSFPVCSQVDRGSEGMTSIGWVEFGRILTMIGFLSVVGPKRCMGVVKIEPILPWRCVALACTCILVHSVISATTEIISGLVFPCGKTSHHYQGPTYVKELVQYFGQRYRTDAGGVLGIAHNMTAWFVVTAVMLASAVWKEFLFRGLYFGGLRTKMPFWVANATTAFVYTMAHQPMNLQATGEVTLNLAASAPLFVGALWYGYLYSNCRSVVVIVLAHVFFNTSLLAIHVFARAVPLAEVPEPSPQWTRLWRNIQGSAER